MASLGLGLVMEDEPSELSSTSTVCCRSSSGHDNAVPSTQREDTGHRGL